MQPIIKDIKSIVNTPAAIIFSTPQVIMPAISEPQIKNAINPIIPAKIVGISLKISFPTLNIIPKTKNTIIIGNAIVAIKAINIKNKPNTVVYHPFLIINVGSVIQSLIALTIYIIYLLISLHKREKGIW